jgi:methylenetetrahydrofolate--tRNA-(uracil-5-)-methyltransferase
MRPKVGTFAHRTGSLAEMVCSNSFRSDDDEQNAVGLLHWEMRQAGGLIMEMADRHRLPAGGALAVDRDPFAEAVTARLTSHPNVTVAGAEITALSHRWNLDRRHRPPDLRRARRGHRAGDGTGQPRLLRRHRAHRPCRHDRHVRGVGAIPLRQGRDGGRAHRLYQLPDDEGRLRGLHRRPARRREDGVQARETAGYFDGCLPIEVMAERGRETLRHGPMKPVGLTNPHNPGEKAYAVVQLRRDNKLGTLYNIVGFQTKMKYGAQTDVFRMIPGLQDASFARLGGIHRNTFINSPTLLDEEMRLRSKPHIRFAGQITGVEGYVESAAMGLLAGRMAAAEIAGTTLPPVPRTTAMGALVHHITGGAEAKTFQPMNVNFGLFPPVDGPRGGRRGRRDRYKAYTDRAKADWLHWLGPDRSTGATAAE